MNADQSSSATIWTHVIIAAEASIDITESDASSLFGGHVHGSLPTHGFYVLKILIKVLIIIGLLWPCRGP